MTIEAQYAQALFALVERNPDKSQEYLSNLKKALEEKGYEKMFTRIFSEYVTILERKERSRRYSETTPEHERIGILLELYRKLVTSS